MKIEIIDRHNPLYQMELQLRFELLREPLGMTRAQVVSDIESECVHFVLTSDNQVHGCVLMYRTGDAEAKLLQMAVHPACQGGGYGSKLVAAFEESAYQSGIRSVTLHSREVAVGFYAHLGYESFGEPFLEVGILHVRMRKSL